MTTDEISIIRPDDWHLHLRDGESLASTVAAAALHFRRAIVMPNLQPPVTNIDRVLAYRQRILDAVAASPGTDFEPLMTLYLTDSTSQQDIDAAADSGLVHGVKLYPAGATTNSESGVTRLEACFPALERMQERDLPLLVHGEVTDADVDIFDREAVFIERRLMPLVERFPRLRVVFEHVTTRDAVQFVSTAREGIGATITPQHLMLNRNALFDGGLRPHAWCLPVLKREPHRLALLEAAISGSDRFFIGTDSAPHSRQAKQSSCGCAGIFSSPTAMSLYADIFDRAGALSRLEHFSSVAGPAFYRLPVNTDRLLLQRDPWQPPDDYPLGQDRVVPMGAGSVLEWRARPA